MTVAGEHLIDTRRVKGAWWNKLPEDFYKQKYATFLDGINKTKVRGSAAIDILSRTGLATAAMASMAPQLFSPARIQQDIQHYDFYKDCADRGDREEVFPAPPRDVKISRKVVANTRFTPQHAVVEILSFDSPYQTLNPALQEDYKKMHQGVPAVAQHWRHPDGARPTLIFTHGFGVEAFWLNSLFFSFSKLYEQGYDILFHTLPFHGPRRGDANALSGMGYFSHGFSHMNEAFLQGVYDLRIWMNYLEAQGVTAMGATGYSLGGYTTALAACCDERLKFAVPNAPAVLLMDMLMGWPPLNMGIRRMMKKTNMNLAEMRHVTAVHCPLNWDPVIAPERLMVIGGAGDRFTPPQFVNALHKHWQGSLIEWFPGNHLIHFSQPAYMRKMKQFMDEACAS